MPTIHRLAYRLLGDAFEAEDVCQETFVKFWQAASGWRSGEAKVLTWLCRVATHDCYDRLRRKRPDLPGDLSDRADDRMGAETGMARSQRWDALQAAMMRLPERQRAALSFCYDHALSQREAAKAMNIGEKAYESLLVRGRRTLKTMMQEDDHV